MVNITMICAYTINLRSSLVLLTITVIYIRKFLRNALLLYPKPSVATGANALFQLCHWSKQY